MLFLLSAVVSLMPFTAPWVALLLGVGFAISFGNPSVHITGKLSKYLLQLAVVGLGAGVNIAIVAQVGGQGLGYTLIGLVTTFLLGGILAKYLQVSEKISSLICAGTAICGGSAIAAVAPVISASAAEISAALATVFLLNGVALFIFPTIGTWASLDPHQFGLWCALAIHDTSSVTGAALTHGTEALATATTVKLARALWIVPVAMLLGARSSANAAVAKRTPLMVPWFVLGFVTLSGIFTLMPDWCAFADSLVKGSRSLLALTLFLIGAGLNGEAIRIVGVRPLVHGLILWAMVATGSLTAIRWGWIH